MNIRRLLRQPESDGKAFVWLFAWGMSLGSIGVVVIWLLEGMK